MKKRHILDINFIDGSDQDNTSPLVFRRVVAEHVGGEREKKMDQFLAVLVQRPGWNRKSILPALKAIGIEEGDENYKKLITEFTVHLLTE